MVGFEELALDDVKSFADVKVLLFRAFAPVSVVRRQLQVWDHVGVQVPVDVQMVVDVKLHPAGLSVFGLFVLLVERVLHHARVKVVGVRV